MAVGTLEDLGQAIRKYDAGEEADLVPQGKAPGLEPRDNVHTGRPSQVALSLSAAVGL